MQSYAILPKFLSKNAILCYIKHLRSAGALGGSWWCARLVLVVVQSVLADRCCGGGALLVVGLVPLVVGRSAVGWRWRF